MDKTIVKTTIKTCKELCGDGWNVKARIEEQSKNGVSNWMVGLFFLKDTKQKFAGVTVKSKARAKELLESFQAGLDQYRGTDSVDVEEEDVETEDENDDEEPVVKKKTESVGKKCSCGVHAVREPIVDKDMVGHMICEHGRCLCDWQDDGVRLLGKLFGADIFAKTRDKKVLEKITKIFSKASMLKASELK